MFDELERLARCAELYRLLEHYARLGSADREVWQDRRMELEAVEPRQLSRLHGELIAFGWVEQNTVHTTADDGCGVGRCYRVTSAGLRALRQAGREQPADEGRQREPVGAASSEPSLASPTS